MSDRDDENATRDPRITPLGDNAGVHVRSDAKKEAIEIDFGGFVLSLATTCLMHLGRYEGSSKGEEAPVDFDAARQMIHVLEMLEEKTEGNLEMDEAQLLRTLLYDLRIAYVESTR